MSDFDVLKEYYIRFLKNVRGNNEVTVKHYIGALSTISKYLVDQGILVKSIYEVNEYSELEIIREFLFSQKEFIEKDERGNRMYSAGLNNYIRFAAGTEFELASEAQIKQFDIAVPINGKQIVTVEQWKRNGIIKKQSIEMAKYSCEINQNHVTFQSAASGHPYMEGHHIIPYGKQDGFEVSLDVYANIICLCPICHRFLHYGVVTEKQTMLDQIYEKRSERLVKSGIKLSKNEFIEIAGA